MIVGMIVGIFILLFFSMSLLFPDMCGNDITRKIDSPNKDYVAYLFTRDCGATTRYSYQLSILKNGEELENEGGNTFVSYSPFEVKWKSPYQLNVSYDKNADTFEKDEKVGKVRISYE